MMEESLHTIRKRIIKSYVTRLLLAGQMKMSKNNRPELSTRTLVEEIHKTNSDAMRMATKMEEHPFTMKECERALDDLISKEEEGEEEEENAKKKKTKRDELTTTPQRGTLKERKAAWLEKKKKLIKWSKRYEKKNGEEPVAFFSYHYTTVEKKMKEAATAGDEVATSPVYISQKRKSKLERELILKHVLTGRNSYWGHNEDPEEVDGGMKPVAPAGKAAAAEGTPKKAPGPPRAVPKSSPLPKPSPTKTIPTTTRASKNDKTSVAPDRVKALARVLDPTVPVDQVQNIPRQPILEKRKREAASANKVDDSLQCSKCGKVFPTAHGCSLHVSRYCSGSTPTEAAATMKKEAPKKSAKTIRMEELIEKKAADEAMDGVTEKMTSALIKKHKDAKNGQVKEEAKKKKKKQRKNKVEDDGDHFAQVKWIGEKIPQQSKLTSNRMYYEGFIKSDVEYRVGGCAYLLPGNPEEPMYIAQIESCFEDNTGKWCECRWFWRAHELTDAGEKSLPPVSKNGNDKFDPEREIMLTQTVDKQPMTCLENSCEVFGSRKEADASKKTEEGGSNFERLYCNWAYTVISATKQGKVKGVFTKVSKRKGGKGFEFPNAISSEKKKKK